MITLILLIIILGILIFVHELGHYLAAKYYGVHVHEFALGMGPKIFSFKRKNKKDPTLYSLRALPIGGFCAMAGEVDEESDNPEVKTDKTVKIRKDEYMCNKTKWQRFVILFAGSFFNFILAFILFFMMSMIWGHNDTSSRIGAVCNGEVMIMEDGNPVLNEANSEPVTCNASVMYNAGVRAGDKIISVNGHRVRNWDRYITVINLRHDPEEPFVFIIESPDGTRATHRISPERFTDEDGNERMQFGMGQSAEVYTGFLTSLRYGGTRVADTVSTMGFTISSLITGRLSLSNLGGPVAMYGIVGELSSHGISALMFLTAFLAINLGVINLLPFPAVDGGRIVFILVETITRRKVPQKVEGIMHIVGFALLMLLMLYVTIMDIWRLF